MSRLFSMTALAAIISTTACRNRSEPLSFSVETTSVALQDTSRTASPAPYEPEVVNFYTMNDFYLGAKIVLRNSRGQQTEGRMPARAPSYAGYMESVDLKLRSPGHLTEGYTVTVYNRHGKVVRFRTTHTGSPEHGSDTYLHIHGVCSNRYLWPEMYVNWAEVDVLPVGRVPGPPTPADLKYWAGCADY